MRGKTKKKGGGGKKKVERERGVWEGVDIGGKCNRNTSLYMHPNHTKRDGGRGKP